jgi:hypothetical protein
MTSRTWLRLAGIVLAFVLLVPPGVAVAAEPQTAPKDPIGEFASKNPRVQKRLEKEKTRDELIDLATKTLQHRGPPQRSEEHLRDAMYQLMEQGGVKTPPTYEAESKKKMYYERGKQILVDEAAKQDARDREEMRRAREPQSADIPKSPSAPTVPDQSRLERLRKVQQGRIQQIEHDNTNAFSVRDQQQRQQRLEAVERQVELKRASQPGPLERLLAPSTSAYSAVSGGGGYSGGAAPDSSDRPGRSAASMTGGSYGSKKCQSPLAALCDPAKVSEIKRQAEKSSRASRSAYREAR